MCVCVFAADKYEDGQAAIVAAGAVDVLQDLMRTTRKREVREHSQATLNLLNGFAVVHLRLFLSHIPHP